MDNSFEREANESKRNEKKQLIADKYKEACKETDILKEIERLKQRIAKGYINFNLKVNGIQKEPEKEKEKKEETNEKDKTNNIRQPVNNDLESISRIALNIVNKVSFKKENKTHNDSPVKHEAEDNDIEKEGDAEDSDEVSNKDEDDKDNKSNNESIPDKGENEEDVKDEPIKISELQSDKEEEEKKDKEDDADQIPIKDSEEAQNKSESAKVNKQTTESQPEAKLIANKPESSHKKNKALQGKESPQKDSSSFSGSQLNQKFQSQIKMIEEKSESNLMEHEQNLKELRKIEETLQINERITHENREIRKNACKEITEMCLEDFNEEERNDFFKLFSPWVKYYIEETNPYVLPEALNFFLVFNTTFPEFKGNSLNDFFDNLERLTSFGISSLNDLSKKIIDMLMKDKKLFNQTFTELMKSMNKPSIRLSKFLNEVLSDMIIKGVLNEYYIKILFEKTIHMYLSINAKNSEKKRANGQLIILIYCILEDDLTTIQSNIQMTSKKEFNSLLSKAKKSNHEQKYRLYSLVIPTETDLVGQNSEHNSKQKGQPATEGPNQNSPQMVTIPSEVNDLCLLLPNAFFEFNLLTQYTEKISLLEEVNKILSKVNEVKDKDKSYFDIYKALNFSIEDSNILIHLEGIKAFKHIARLLQSHIHNQKAKCLLESSFEKLKDKKSIVRDELFSLFDVILDNACLSFDSFITLILQFSLNNQKKAVPIVKQGLLEYLKLLLKTAKAPMSECVAVKNEKSYLTYSKYLIDLIFAESQSNIKDLCTDLLLIFKSKMRSEENLSQFAELTKGLPNYRKDIVTNDKADYCASESNNSYKRKLKNVKSNIPSKSISKEKKLNCSFRKDNTSTPKNSQLKSTKALQGIGKANDLHKSNSTTEVSKPQNKNPTNMKVIKQEDVDSKADAPFKRQAPNKMTRDIEANEENKKKEILEKRKDNVVNHISSLNLKALEDYSKVIVRDFLFFVNKVSLGSLNDDLTSHFKVIFNILGKILERMLHLNSTYQQEMSLTESTSNQISDDLINRIIKVVIILPCIDQVEGSSEFDLYLFNSFIASIRKASTSEEKFFMYLLINLIKFSNKGQGFLERINPRPSILFFLDYITQCKVKSDRVQSMLNEFVEETEMLSKEDKTKYLTIKGVSPITSREVTQNIADEDEVDVDTEEKEGEKVKLSLPETKKDDEDFLAKKIKESEELIKMKQEENERLKQKIRKYEEKKNSPDQSSSFIPEASASTQIIPTVQQQPMQLQPSLQSHGNLINKLIEESKESIINNLKCTNSGDILKIKEQFNLTTRKLDQTLKRMVEKKGNRDRELQEQALPKMASTLQSSQQYHQINDNPPTLLTPIKQIRNLEDCLTEEQEQSMQQDNQSEIQHAINQTPQSNLNSLQNLFNFQQEPSSNYKPLIKQLLSFFTGNSHQLNIDELFDQLSVIYRKQQTPDLKFDYIDYLKDKLLSPSLLDRIPVNVYLQFYDYVINLLSFELMLTPRNDSIVMHLQSITESLKGYRKLSEMIEMMLFLLRKYFPKNLSNRISDNACVALQIIAYIIKELVKMIAKNKVEPKEIIAEINELFTVTPPDSLKTSTPNYKLYEHIFTVLKSLTDEVYDQHKHSFKDVIEYLNDNKITNKAYLKYLRNLCGMTPE